MNTTKIPTTYSAVHAGDMIDGETVIAVRNDSGQTALCFADLQWGPWQPASTPVSVYR
jgi:hypothetical protein